MKRFAVIGLGKFGFHVARALYEEGHEVVAVDRDRARVQSVDPYCSEAVILEATDKEGLQALGLEKMDAVVVSVGTRISDSILICLYLQEMGAGRILAKATDEDHAKVLKRVGATQIIHPEKEMAQRVARSLSTPNVLDFIPLAEDYSLVQLGAPKAFVGKSLQELQLRTRYHVQAIAVEQLVPQEFLLAPPADFVIKDSDVLVLLGRTDDVRKLQEMP